MALAGTLIVESRRDFLDFADMSTEEAKTFSELLERLYPAVRAAVGAERIYLVAMMESCPHFHVWLVPRGIHETLRGIPF
jgi:diadenosine tetraphosphate (Ap4A) HIT family hydrolase